MKEIGDEEKAASAGGGQPAFEQGGDVMLNVVAGDDAWTRLAGAVEDFNLLFGEEPRRKRRECQLFFLTGHSR